MNDDWRVRARLEDEQDARELLEELSRFELAHELGESFRDRVMVSRDRAEVFLYAGSRPQALAAQHAVDAVAARHRWTPRCEVSRWHPESGEWEDADVPLPADSATRAAERAERMEEERRESREQGYPDFEVRVRCPSRREAVELADRLLQEGIPCARRWEFLAFGAADEDTAAALAERVRAEAPSGSAVEIEATMMKVVDEAPFATPFNPFAVFGGFGG